MNPFENIDFENSDEESWSVAPEDETDELREDEISPREAAFLEGYAEANKIDLDEEKDDWD